jgi:quercetin dioxygenase-like cupin family protein
MTAAALAASPAAEAQQTDIGSWGRGWSSGPRGLGPGVSFFVIDGNPQPGPHTVHTRYPAGHTVGPRTHKSTEHVIVLSGTLLVGWGEVWDPTKFKEVRAGETVVVPAGVVHFSSAREETVMELG